MAFQTVPFNIVGGTYENRSRPLSSQRTVNMYQQVNEKGKDPASLNSFPGQKLISSIDGTLDRNQHRLNNDQQIQVLDRTLYTVDSTGFRVARGTIDGDKRCIFADDGISVFIVTDKIYQFNTETNILTEVTDVNIVGAQSVTFLNSTFIYTKPDFSTFSDVGNGASASGLNIVGAESSPDALVRDYAFNQTLYRFGVHTTEPWYNSGVGSPPFDRIEGQEFSVGLGAIHSAAHTDNALYWLGDDKAIYRVSGNIHERISDDGISNTIERMTTIDDAFGYTFTLQGQDFYLITFPSEGVTLVLNESLGINGWFNLSSGLEGGVYSGTSLVNVYGKNIVVKGGDLLELSLDEFTQDTDIMLQQRTMLPITRKNIPSNIKGRRIKISRIEFIMEQGIGLISGQGEAPRMLLELSFDGGRSFAHSQWVELGRMGENTLEVVADVMASADEIIPRITISDPIPVSITAALVDIKAVAK